MCPTKKNGLYFIYQRPKSLAVKVPRNVAIDLCDLYQRLGKPLGVGDTHRCIITPTLFA